MSTLPMGIAAGKADDGHHPAGGLAFSAVGKKFVRIALSAGRHVMSMLWLYSSQIHLCVQDLAEIQMIFPG